MGGRITAVTEGMLFVLGYASLVECLACLAGGSAMERAYAYAAPYKQQPKQVLTLHPHRCHPTMPKCNAAATAASALCAIQMRVSRTPCPWSLTKLYGQQEHTFLVVQEVIWLLICTQL